MIETYLTIQKNGCDETVIQKSRFIGYAAPCATEEEALQFIRSVREKHRDARHHCYAYIIGRNRGIMRYSDDGEPGGTAGMPMMDVLKNEGVVDCCVVVVRYFGGILLGTGGLVRAYTQGCKTALQASGIVRMELCTAKRCRVSYNLWNQIQNRLQKMPVVLDDVAYTDSVEFAFYTRKADLELCAGMLENMTDGKIQWLDEEEKYLPWTL